MELVPSSLEGGAGKLQVTHSKVEYAVVPWQRHLIAQPPESSCAEHISPQPICPS